MMPSLSWDANRVMVQAWWVFFLLMSVSYVVGYLTLHPVVILGLVLVLFLRFPLTITLPPTPRLVWGAGLVFVALAAFPLMVIHSPYNVSTDIFHTLFVRVLDVQNHIPTTMLPYADYPMAYPLGFHVGALQLVRFFPWADFLTLWMLGLAALFSLPFFLHHFLLRLGAPPRSAAVAPLLGVGTYILLFNHYTGLYPALFALVVGLWCLMAVAGREKHAPLLVMGVWLLHPGVAIYVSFMLVTFLIWKKRVHDWTSYALALPLLLPLAPFLLLVASRNGPSQLVAEIMIGNARAVPVFAGYVLMTMGPVLVGLTLYAYLKRLRAPESPAFYFFLGHVVASVALFFALAFVRSPLVLQTSFFHKLLEWMVLSMTGFIAFSRVLEGSTPAIRRVIPIALVLVGLAFSLVQPSLNYYRVPGEKIDLAAAQFGSAFYSFDPLVKRVFYFTPYGSKISEYAHKSPYDPTHSYFLPPYDVPADLNYAGSTHALAKIVQTSTHILDTNCFSCVNGLNVDYVVIPNAYEYAGPGTRVLDAHGYSAYTLPI